jgi:mannose/cellobiose epimerase-like protein (N-acyl-D-glucosamine 2-epimerase family)
MNVDFTFSDLLTGYVVSHDFAADTFVLRTSDGRDFNVKLTATVFAEMVRNLGEGYLDCTGNIRDMLETGRFLFVYGIFFPEKDKPFEAKHIVFTGRTSSEFRFEKQDWWIKQIEQLADFYIEAQFGKDEIDYRNYRTHLTIGGSKEGDFRQETDTISRLVYGFASAFLITGNEKYLEAAEKGTEYLRAHFRALESSEDMCYWYHAIDVKGKKEKKILASEFGDDYDAIPAYEQIYALAGPVQTYRATGDAKIAEDARLTINLFEKYFKDIDLGGYFSHIDPITFDPRADSLTRDRARKNWNSVGDHAPAYLINLYLATGNETYGKMLKYCADNIVEHFPDYGESAFVQEKFHEDWSKDQQWGWQQNRAVVGHNLKIAWNLMRIISDFKDDRYKQMAEKIASLMPEHGMDKQRCGWYDVVERTLADGEKFHRFAWHDRKAWWQQEQGILAYLILYGILGKPEYLKYARESSSFYNSWFLDHDSGGVYFNVLANGMPYLLGTEREKGSHSMSGYHSFELCYLAAVYTNLLITKEAMDFYFMPYPNSLPDGILRVSPDILPKGSVRIESVEIDGLAYGNFSSEELYVTLPETDKRLKVKVKLAPKGAASHFGCKSETDGKLGKIYLSGDFDSRGLSVFRLACAEIAGAEKVAIIMSELQSISPEGVRAITFEKQKLDLDEPFYIVGAKGQPLSEMQSEELTEECTLVDSLSDVE